MILRIEPFSGLSGDMWLGALVELTGAGDKLRALPATLGLAGAAVRLEEANKNGIQCTQAVVIDETEPKARHLADIVQMIDAADLPDGVKDFSRRVFEIVGEAEAAVHGVSIEHVHFHEVGAVDSIIDVVGAALLLNELGIEDAFSDPICTGSGFVDCDHGRFPVPAPATERILHGLPTFPGAVAKEMTTPTGAAILKALSPSFAVPPLVITDTGYGAGQRDLEQPNCLRLGLATATAEGTQTEQAWLIQTNLDDTTGELLGGHLQEQLLGAGALDVTLCALLMKKGRPGQRLEVLCHAPQLPNLIDRVLAETSAIGVRYFPVGRTVLPRTSETITTRYGDIGLKVVTLPSGQIRKTPEYEDCRRCAAETGAGLQDVMREAWRFCTVD